MMAAQRLQEIPSGALKNNHENHPPLREKGGYSAGLQPVVDLLVVMVYTRCRIVTLTSPSSEGDC